MQFYGYHREDRGYRQVIVTKEPGLLSRTKPTAVTYRSQAEADADMARLNCAAPACDSHGITD